MWVTVKSIGGKPINAPINRTCHGKPVTGNVIRLAAVGSKQPADTCYPFDMKVSEVLRMLQTDGWYLAATRGSHRQFKHASKPGRVTVPGKPSDDLALGTLNSILKQAGFK